MSRAALVLLALAALVALVGCANAARRIAHTPLAVSQRTFHSANGNFSVRQVEQAFADQGVRLRNVTQHGWGRILAFLDGRPAHQVFVYVSLQACKCMLRPPIRHARSTHHGNVDVLWQPAEGPAVRAALRELR